ncbi:MAG TPA: RnfABCDGE type electron transport complex subunit D [Treponemataceae bacterium]|nr:RnfABCDGE type electron transport complex subunit D [Treponemataceae bacterium]
MGESDKNEIYISPAPHFAVPMTTRQTMFVVIAALLPIAAYGVWLFGFPALVTIVAAVASTVVFESLFRLVTRQDVRAGDLSAAVSGLLLAMVLPPTTPVWMTILGGLFAMVVAKEFFGGLGANVFNPALSGRAFLLVSFATPMTTWIAPSLGKAADAVTSATPLAYIKPAEGAISTAAQIAEKLGYSSAGDLYLSYFMGARGGCIGESAIFLIAFAFVALVATRIIDWRAPVAMIVTACAVTWIAGINPLLTLLSGGLAFGAVFMATDYATSPVTPIGRLIFGAGCGLITALVRVFGGYPEGVMFSILIMNSLVPFLNKIIPRKYGWVRPAKKEGVAK